MRRYILPLCLALILLISGCDKIFRNPFSNPFGGGGGNDDRTPAQPNRVLEPTQKFSIAIGGVAAGRDELILYDENGNIRTFVGDPLACTPSDDGVVKLLPRPDYETASEGSGVQIVALAPGVTAITCVVGDIDLNDIYEVTVPHQSLIQILVAEAGTQLLDEADIDDELGEDVVSLSSSSPTGNAIASAIRNRIEIINDLNDPSIFSVDGDAYDFDPLASYYDEIILAEGQFSPTDPSDPNHDIFMDAKLRKYMFGDWQITYDQAVLTAASIFNGDIQDSTGGAFAFRSPTEDEWDLLANAWGTGASEIPEGSGFTDDTFPDLAPIQILIHPDVWTYDGGRPAFVFARKRSPGDSTITNSP